MLLHGLAGYANEWSETASWLTAHHKVVAPDSRGHGRSGRVPIDTSRVAHIADVVAWIGYFGDGPVSLVGQSLGGHTAFLVAARHPDKVRKLVVAEAAPGALDERPDQARQRMVVERLTHWLSSWPVPFASRGDAVAFFGRNENWAQAWADGLEERADGLYPSFDVEVMAATLMAAAGSYWDDWRNIRCPTLLVVAEDRESPELAQKMIREQPLATLVEIPDAGHDLHLDNPIAWRAAIEAFLA